MTRKETTQFLTDLLIRSRLSDRKYFAREVTLDYDTTHSKRIDVVEFRPQGVTYTSEIEKGIFVCYEIKSCYDDVYSGNGLNFYGEKNYIVTTMETYKRLQEDLRSAKLTKHIAECMGVKSSPRFGVMVPVPIGVDLRNVTLLYQYFENPPELDLNKISSYQMWIALPQQREQHRTRSMNELLFCMLRAKHSWTNSRRLKTVSMTF